MTFKIWYCYLGNIKQKIWFIQWFLILLIIRILNCDSKLISIVEKRNGIFLKHYRLTEFHGQNSKHLLYIFLFVSILTLHVRYTLFFLRFLFIGKKSSLNILCLMCASEKWSLSLSLSLSLLSLPTIIPKKLLSNSYNFHGRFFFLWEVIIKYSLLIRIIF